jgi:hypothetical protein
MRTKTLWVTKACSAAVLVVAASACANLIGLSDYEVDESSAGGTGGGGSGGAAGGGTAGSAGTGGCIPTGNPRQCGNNGECCDFAADQARCVNFPDRGAFCSSRCTTNSQCTSNCCVPLDSGNSACAFPEFCGAGGTGGGTGGGGTGGTGGTGGAGGSGGIGSPCTGSGTCGSGTNAGTCNGRWCTRPCTTSIDCPGNNWCIRNNAGTNTCFVGCTSNANCASLTGTTCQSATTIDDLPMSVCSLPPSS